MADCCFNAAANEIGRMRGFIKHVISENTREKSFSAESSVNESQVVCYRESTAPRP